MKTTLSPVVIEQLKNLKAAIFDVDGVFFSGQVFVGPDGNEVMKPRTFVDGQGLSLLRAIGIQVAFITGEEKFIGGIVEKLNGLPSVTSGAWSQIHLVTGKYSGGKVEAAEQWLASIGVSFEESSYMGDDLADVPLLRRVGLPAAPAQAEEVVKKIAKFVSERRGGDGAVRDFANAVLEVRGIDPESLPIK